MIAFILLDFLLTTVCFWLLTILLPFIGITIAFSWGKAIIFWLICKVIKMLF